MKNIFFVFVLFFFTHLCFAQNPDQSILDKIEEEDSLITEVEATSNFVVRIDYYNKTLSAGRDLGVQQYSFTPSLTYNHKSGISLSLSGYYYSENVPNYNMTDFGISYSNIFKFNDNWSYSLSYDHYFYNPDSAGVLTNNAGLFTSYDFGKISTSLSYGYSFGNNETGNSLSPSVSGFFEIKNVGFINKIQFLPGISATFGNSNITFRRFNSNQFQKGHDGLTYQQVQSLKKSEFSNLIKEYRTFKKENPDTKETFSEFAKDKNGSTGFEQYQENHPGATYLNYLNALKAAFNKTDTKNEFGLMSLNFSIPVRFKVDKLTFGVTYNYIIPFLLPNDTEDNLPNQSYFSAMVSYKIGK